MDETKTNRFLKPWKNFRYNTNILIKYKLKVVQLDSLLNKYSFLTISINRIRTTQQGPILRRTIVQIKISYLSFIIIRQFCC